MALVRFVIIDRDRERERRRELMKRIQEEEE
jgi:hypothetical protein